MSQKKPKIYVASSWRNPDHHHVVTQLKHDGFDPFDFKATNASFHWRDQAPGWPDWSLEQFKSVLRSQPAEEAFANDEKALDEADAGVLVLPAGISAHIEVGYLMGQLKPTFILYPTNVETVRAELMYKLATGIFRSYHDVAAALADIWPNTPEITP